MSLLVVGSVAYDSIKTETMSVDEVLGGSAVYFSLAASTLTDVKLVAVVGEDFKTSDIQLLRSRSIGVEGLTIEPGETFRWVGEYTPDFNQAITHATRLNVFERFNPVLPPSYTNSDYVFLANIDPDLQHQVVSQIENPRLTACDTMNFWIDGKRESLERTIRGVDMLFINDAELRSLTRTDNLLRAADLVLSWGLTAVVVKQGSHGATLVRGDRVFHTPAFPLRDVVDTTGAGDSFAGGFMATLARLDRIDFDAMKQALAIGTIVASYNVQCFSVENLANLTIDKIRDRFEPLRAVSALGELEI
ncbi:sugar kinase [bacterium]|nr:sugar kinase [candidate division CSSED10-310 bacterium]